MNNIEGNKLIAEFMGLRCEIDDGKLILWSNKGRYWYGKLYDEDWNELMKVVQKIGKMYNPYKYKAHEEKEYAWEIIELTIMNPINEVYDSVLTFIKWYNLQSI